MNLTELSGTLLQELSLRKDKNDHDYYLGRLNCDDGSQTVCFFFQPNYDLVMRLVDLKANQEMTLKGYWGITPNSFIASDFYLVEVSEFSWSKSNNELNERGIN